MSGAPESTSYVNTTLNIKAADITFGHAWRADGLPHAIVRLGQWGGITLNSAAHAEALISAATAARDALAGLEASAPPATDEERAEFEAWRASRDAAAETRDGA